MEYTLDDEKEKIRRKLREEMRKKMRQRFMRISQRNLEAQ